MAHRYLTGMMALVLALATSCGEKRMAKDGYLPEGTVVMTVEGPRRIETVGPGAQVVSFNDAEANVDFATVKKLYASEISTVQRIELESGVSLTVRKDKRVLNLAYGSWSRVNQMHKGDEVMYLNEMGEPSRSVVSRVVPQNLSYPVRVYGLELDKKQGIFANDILLR